MQLILNSDTDIGVQKMSTIQQESLDEKFITNNLIEKVCTEIGDITNGNNVSVTNQEVEKVCGNNMCVDERTSQFTEESNSEPIANDMHNIEYKAGKIHDIDLVENIGNDKLDTQENTQFDNDKIVEAKKYIEVENELSLKEKEKELDNHTKDDKCEDDENLECDIPHGKIENEIEQNETTVPEIKENDNIRNALEDELEEKQKENCLLQDKLEDWQHEECTLKNKLENPEQVALENKDQDMVCPTENEPQEEQNDNSIKENRCEEIHATETETMDLEEKIEDCDMVCEIENKLEELKHDNCAQRTIFEERDKVAIPLEDKINDQDMTCEIENLPTKSEFDANDKEPINDLPDIENVVEDQNVEEYKINKQDDNNAKENNECCQKENNKIGDLARVATETEDNAPEYDSEIKELDAKIEEKCKKMNETQNFSEDASNNQSVTQVEINKDMSVNYDEDVDMKSVHNERNDSNLYIEQEIDIKTGNKSELEERIQENSNNQIIESKISVDKENISEIEKETVLLHESDKDHLLNINRENKVIQLDCADVIDIADENEDCEATNDDKHMIDNEIVDNINRIEKDIATNENIALGQVDDDQEIVTTSEIPEVSIQQENVDRKVKKPDVEKVLDEKKKLTHICKLSNTLDILSDEDEDNPQDETRNDVPATEDKQCINTDDDDVIMVIDEESNAKENKEKNERVVEQEITVQQNEECKTDVKDETLSDEMPTNQADSVSTKDTASEVDIKNEPQQITTESKDNVMQPKQLLPINFLKTCKKNLAEMTRDELEEFCILKIVESVVDRSDLSEIKTQLKSMAINIEEYRKKAFILTKQNRDLQVVLKSVQEEQKKKSNLPITPLKITRSVGMQVLMTDKSGVRRKPTQSPNTPNSLASNTASSRSVKGQTNQSSKLQKIQSNSNNMSPIPVPRLVPAVNNTNLNNVKLQPPNTNIGAKAQAGQVANSVANVPVQSVSNGLPTLTPAPKPEKRPHSRMQQSNSSVTVDLTDDEPPAKVVQRNMIPPVRLVPSQNLLAPHRPPFGPNINSPRKVYIPISGSQNQGVGVRPGQTIMLKTISPQGPRQRCQSPAIGKTIVTPPTNTVRMQRISHHRHPAPLPDSMKQYQPPNWKALPPAPELKLSKVENGIVISWKIDGYQEENYEEIASYQLYAYQETSSPPSTALWKKIGDVKALPLPMACTLTQFMAGYKYYFAVRAVDIRSRLGPFSSPGSILLLNKM